MRRNILLISAHPDDAYIAMGGTIVRLIEIDKYNIHHVVFSIASESPPPDFHIPAVMQECQRVNDFYGFPPDALTFHDFPVRDFPEYRQEILELLIKLKRTKDPLMVFTPSSYDTHQDHKVIYEESCQAFSKHCSIYGYDFPWNILDESKLNMFFELKLCHVFHKMKALQLFKSQLGKANNCLSPKYIQALAIERGNRIGVDYAEAFELIRYMRLLT